MDPGHEIRAYDNVVSSFDNEDTYNGIPVHQTWNNLTLVNYDRKEGSYASDHRNPTPWSRVTGSIVRNDPYIVRNGSAITKDYLSAYGGSCDDVTLPDGFAAKLGNAEDKAITLARDGLRNKDAYSVGQAIAEARTTAEMLAARGTQMAGGMKEFQRLARSLGQTSAREKLLLGAGAWLEGYYGWGSLARDAFAYDRALRSKIDEPLYIKSKKVVRTSESSDFQDIGLSRDMAVDCDGLVKVEYKARIDSEFVRGLDRWGLANPLSIAWEAAPYSFCLDWFIPIGNTLSSLSATAGLQFVSGYVSRVGNVKRSTIYHNRNGYSSYVTVDPGLYVTQGKRFTRRLAYGFEPPRLYANENPFNTTRIVNAVALIGQVALNRFF